MEITGCLERACPFRFSWKDSGLTTKKTDTRANPGIQDGAEMQTLPALHEFNLKFSNEFPNDHRNSIEKWNDRFDFSSPKILERYLRGDLDIVLHCQTESSECFLMIMLFLRPIRIKSVPAKSHIESDECQSEFSVLVESVQLMDDSEWRIQKVASKPIEVSLNSLPRTLGHSFCFSVMAKGRWGIQYLGGL